MPDMAISLPSGIPQRNPRLLGAGSWEEGAGRRELGAGSNGVLEYWNVGVLK